MGGACSSLGRDKNVGKPTEKAISETEKQKKG
jgi:hypothetical protein